LNFSFHNKSAHPVDGPDRLAGALRSSARLQRLVGLANCVQKPQGISEATKQERARVLNRLCNWIEEGLAKRRTASGLIRKAVRRWNGKPFRTDAARKWKLSEPTLWRIYCAWHNVGPKALEWQYRGLKGTKVPSRLVKRFLKACGRAGSIMEAYREATEGVENAPCATPFYKLIPAALRIQLSERMRERSKARKNERAIEALLARALGGVK
jgi:hypothetical protein